MAHTYTSLNYHIVFSTENRQASLSETIRDRLWPYLGGIARENGMKANSIGGVADHAHVVISIPPSIAVAKAVQLIKGASSRWIKQEYSNTASFAWQDGYGAFTVGQSEIAMVRNYVRNQPEHHRNVSFAEEYRALLEQHHIAIDERYWLG